MREAHVLVFANKQDLPNAMTASELTDQLGLQSLRNRKVRCHQVSFLICKNRYYINRCNAHLIIIPNFKYFSGTFRLRVRPKDMDCMKDLIGCRMNWRNHNVFQIPGLLLSFLYLDYYISRIECLKINFYYTLDVNRVLI